MPSLRQHLSATTTKLLLVGDSGTGKTGALASLADAGYNLRLADLDNGVEVLKNMLLDPKSPYKPDAIDRVNYVTITEPMRGVREGAKVRLSPMKASVWPRLVSLLDSWEDGELKLGRISSWTEQDVLIIDSLTMATNAAFNYTQALNGRLGGLGTQNEIRRDIGGAQQLIEQLLQFLYDASIKCNVVVISHITYIEPPGQPIVTDDKGQTLVGPKRGYPSSIGRSLSPRIPRYFNAMLMADVVGSGASARHRVCTVTDGTIGLKSPAPLRVADSYPLGTGLAQYFKAVREQPAVPAPSNP